MGAFVSLGAWVRGKERDGFISLASGSLWEVALEYGYSQGICLCGLRVRVQVRARLSTLGSAGLRGRALADLLMFGDLVPGSL